MAPDRGMTLRQVTITPAHNSVQSNGGASTSAGSSFEIVRRGYDRDQVDRMMRDMRDRLNAAESARQNAEQHAQKVEVELRSARSAVQAPEPAMSQESFGFRAEKILRLAEHEAADVRNRAANEATNLVEQARAEAERHRHDVEQKLIARSAELDQEAAQRNVAIQEREQQAAVTLAAAREESTRITEEAQRAAEALVSEARVRADELRNRAEQETRRRREAAEHELRRIGGLHDGVRSEMARLHKLLGGELEKATPAGLELAKESSAKS
jgi:cell division septum initiation protein DivIVA